MFLSYVQPSEKWEAHFQRALVVLKDCLIRQTKILADDFSGCLLLSFHLSRYLLTNTIKIAELYHR